MSESEPIWRWSARRLATAVACGDVAACEVLEAHLARVQAVNPRLNALVVPLFHQARRDAEALDRARAAGETLGPLAGVPVSIKEMFDVAGTPTTAGSPQHAADRAKQDAPLVAALRRAGAVVLGKTNVPQGGCLIETDNPLYGRTNNPWNLARSPGGSSGGESAIVAAGGSPLGLGSDGGGSLRCPAHFTGIHTLKPTSGRLDLSGHWTVASFPPRWVQMGPLARHVDDLELALGVLAAVPGDPRPPAPLADSRRLDIAGLRVGVYEDDGFFRPSPAIRRAVAEAAAALAGRGAQVEPFALPDSDEMARIYFGLFYADGLDDLMHWLEGDPIDWRVRRYRAFGRLPAWIRPLGRMLMILCGQHYAARTLRYVRRPRLTPDRVAQLVADEDQYRQRFLAALDRQRLDALIGPPCGLPALTHGCFYGSLAASYTFLYNLLGLPAGVVAATRVRPDEQSDRAGSLDVALRAARKVERGSAGLPIGVQVAARPWREDVVLAVMRALEDHFRGQSDYPAEPPI